MKELSTAQDATKSASQLPKKKFRKALSGILSESFLCDRTKPLSSSAAGDVKRPRPCRRDGRSVPHREATRREPSEILCRATSHLASLSRRTTKRQRHAKAPLLFTCRCSFGTDFLRTFFNAQRVKTRAFKQSHQIWWALLKRRFVFSLIRSHHATLFKKRDLVYSRPNAAIVPFRLGVATAPSTPAFTPIPGRPCILS